MYEKLEERPQLIDVAEKMAGEICKFDPVSQKDIVFTIVNTVKRNMEESIKHECEKHEELQNHIQYLKETLTNLEEGLK